MKRTSLTNWFILIIVCTVLLASILGCGLADRLRSASNTASNTSVDNRGTLPDFPKAPKSGEKLYESQGQLEEFSAALISAIGTEDPKLLELLIYDSYAMVQVQDPNKPENIDGYTWRDGKLSPPSPVKIIGGGKIEDNVFRLKEVNIDGLPALTKEVMDKLKDVEGGTMVGYSIKRALPFDKDVRILVLANSSRKSVSAEADKDAKLKKFEIR